MRHGHSEGIGVEVVEEVLVVVAGAVAVGIPRRQVAFASGIAGGPVPATEEHPSAPEDMNADCRLAIRSHLLTAPADCRC